MPETTASETYYCWNEDCVGNGQWPVLVDGASGMPLDGQDADCPTCGEEGGPDAE